MKVIATVLVLIVTIAVTSSQTARRRPARFAGRKVKVIGVLYAKTSILKVDTIADAK